MNLKSIQLTETNMNFPLLKNKASEGFRQDRSSIQARCFSSKPSYTYLSNEESVSCFRAREGTSTRGDYYNVCKPETPLCYVNMVPYFVAQCSISSDIRRSVGVKLHKSIPKNPSEYPNTSKV